MNYIKYRFTLDMHAVQSQISIPVTLGDTARTLYVSLSDGGLPYIIDDGCLAKIEIKRPTGTKLEDFCPIEKNTTIRYEFSQNENTAAVEGIHECNIVIYDTDGSKICTPRFTMIVSDRVFSADDLILTDEDKRIVEAIVAAEVPRQNAELERIRAEQVRQEAEEARAAAEEERATADQQREDGFNDYIERCQIPPITDSDEGKFMRVQNGKWALALTEAMADHTLEASLGTDGRFSVSVKDKYGNTVMSDSVPLYSYGNTDITAGTTPLEVGQLHFVYE